MKHTAVKGIACSMGNSPLIFRIYQWFGYHVLCLHGPRIQNPEAVKKLHLGVLDSTSQPVSWMFGCFAHLMKHWWFWYRNLWLALLRHCLETHSYIHLFLVVVMICFFVHTVCHTISLAREICHSLLEVGAAPEKVVCTPPVVHVDRLVSFPSMTIGDPSYIHRSSEETAYHQLDVKWGTKVVWMSLL